MASFDEHIARCKDNLTFLSEINSKCSNFWDWKVTCCFYVAVHLVNAHTAKVGNLHYRTHEDTKNAINPTSQLSPCKLPEDMYLSYVKLENLSRRSRYMCSDSSKDMSSRTTEKHFAKAIKNLDKLMEYFKEKYNIEFDKYKIACPELSIVDKLYNFKFN